MGYGLYCKLLNEAAQALKGQREETEECKTVMDCDMDAYTPSMYIKNEYRKLDIYRRISGTEMEEEYTNMQDEPIDRLGGMPRSVGNLLTVAATKAMTHKMYVTEAYVN